MANMAYDFLGRGGSASSYSSGDAAWNAYMSSPASKADPFAPSPSSLAYGVGKPRTDASATGTGRYVTGSNGQQYEKLQQGYRNTATGETVSGISLPSKGSNITYSGGGGGYGGGGGGGGGQVSALPPVEFYLGAVPTLPQLNLPSLSLPSSPGAPVLGNLLLPGAPQLSGVDYSGVMDQFRSTFNLLNTGVTPQFGVDANKVASDARQVASKLNLSPSEINKLISGINPSTGEIISDYGKFSKAAAKAGEETANALNAKYQAAFNAAMPGYGSNMAKANELTSTYLSGRIPQDVVDSVYRGAAAKGFTSGIYGGGIGRNIVARDLGLTSLQLQSAGANLLQQTSQIATSVIQATMPVSGAQFADPTALFSASMGMKRVDPTSIFNAVYTPTSQVFDRMSSMAQQSTMARAEFEASKMINPGAVFNVLTQQALYNQQINMQNALNNWETNKTMALQNNQIAEKNAMNSWQAAQMSFQNQAAQSKINYDVQITQAQYNQQIAAQNALNAWQGQALPGQFDIAKGQYVGFQPGTYSSTRPLPPGSPPPKARLNPEEDFMINMGGSEVPASSLKGPAGKALVAQMRAGMRQYAAQQNQQIDAQNAANASWQGSAYRPQIYV